jgi:NAD(P)-dependent dehydrogenase (short-subunit alcohol dehydrogenase family)
MPPLSVLVTGASTGIGEATAYRLSANGHHVFAGVRKDDDGERLRARARGRITPLRLDVTNETHIEQAVNAIAAEVGESGLDGVVNNAGIGRGGPVEYLSLEEWRTQFEVNVFGQVAVTKAMLPLIRKARGRVIFVGSIGGRWSNPFIAPYNSSKFALAAISDSLRNELRGFGIHVSLIEPGSIKTEIWQKGRETADELEQQLPPEGIERYGRVLETAKRTIDFQERHGSDPSEVAKVIEHALTTARPRPRYLVGKDAKLQAALVRLLPHSTRDFIVRRALRL